MGPYLVNPDGKTLRENPNSWNNFASVVYIEAPAGVGYSYSSDGNITTSDDLTAEENYEGLKQFFKKYPNFQNHSTFIIGESYAGIYVPTLTTKIIENQNNFPINLKGIAIGNGLVNDAIYRETELKILYGHGFIDEISWQKFEKTCCNSCVDTCDLNNLPENCINLVVRHDLSVNPYNIYGTCDSDKKANLRETFFNRNLLMMTKSKNGVKSYIPCFNDTDITTYMNQKNVRKALHIPVKLPEWNICTHLHYQGQYSDMTPFYKKIYAAKIPMLLYYGDTDLMCNFLMGQKFSAQLGFPIIEHEKAWKFNGQVGGFKTVYDGLTFTTIRGAGHMAPQWRAPETAYAIKQFVSNQPI
uniref:Carboxypeptidase n=1 Tax=Panagrolaimus davidi TaxID=227884 RepID=A0A914P7Q6_9BILA